MKFNIADLKVQFQSGDNSFLTNISEEYGLYCVRYLYSKHSCDEEFARDIFTDCLLAFRESIIKSKVSEIKNLRSYLLGTCINLLKLEHRKERRKLNKIEEIKRELYIDNPNYEDVVIAAEVSEELKELTMLSLSKLSDNCQHILKLFYVEGFSMTDIAANMNFASQAVAKTTKSRCYQKWIEMVSLIKRDNYVD